MISIQICILNSQTVGLYVFSFSSTQILHFVIRNYNLIEIQEVQRKKNLPRFPTPN